MKKIIFFCFVLSAICSCNQLSKNQEVNNSKEVTTTLNTNNLTNGFKLLEQNCFSCHSPNASLDSRIAPPMEAIKRHYINLNTTEEGFVRDLAAFINDPKIENSKMPGAIKKFGLMPKMDFSEEQLRDIATYIYNTELEKPEWFEKHYQEERKKHLTNSDENKTPLEIGKSIAMQTKSVLGKNLLSALNSKGTEDALSFCSEKAILLTDSMSIALNAKIKRVSDKNRNPENSANAQELAYIESVKNLIAKNLPVKSMLTSTNDKHTVYAPIITNQMCMQCHGKPKADIQENVLSKIKSIYPSDKAIGYKIDELRGIWVVEIDKK